jgi:hypothetical protein
LSGCAVVLLATGGGFCFCNELLLGVGCCRKLIRKLTDASFEPYMKHFAQAMTFKKAHLK